MAQIGGLNNEDPVSAFEANRNDVIYEDYQHNRNPFIDHPECGRDLGLTPT